MLAAATLLMGCGGGGGGQSPEQVATKWRLAYAKGDFETTVDLEAPELHAQNGRAAAIAFEKSLYKPPTPDHQVVAVKAVRTVKDSTDQKNQYVFVYLQVTERDYPAEQETVTLRKVSGAWRVAKWQP
jgi:hypothetical protein